MVVRAGRQHAYQNEGADLFDEMERKRRDAGMRRAAENRAATDAAMTEPAEKPRVRVRAGSEPRPRVRVPAGSSPVEAAPPATQTGGSGPPATTGGRDVAIREPERPPAPRRENLPAVRQQPGVPQPGSTVVDGDPVRAPRNVPNMGAERLPGPEAPRALPAPATPAPAPAAPVARSVAGRVGRAAIGLPGQVAVGVLDPSPTASDDDMGWAQRYGGRELRPVPEEASEPEKPTEEGPGQTFTVPDTVVTAQRPRATRGGSSGRPARRQQGDNSSDELNAISLRIARGEPPTDDPREQRMRARMAELNGMAKGGRVEGYAAGGGVGAKRDGLAIKGRTKAKFC